MNDGHAIRDMPRTPSTSIDGTGASMMDGPYRFGAFFFAGRLLGRFGEPL
jgi:hypothetical protein